jgi:hypothetical protein
MDKSPYSMQITLSSNMIATSRGNGYQRRAEEVVGVWTTTTSCSTPDFLMSGSFLRAVMVCSPNTDTALLSILTITSARG